MSFKRSRQMLSLLLTLLLLASASLSVFAQQPTEEPEDATPEFTGIVEEVGDNTLVVSGVTFLTEEAEMEDDDALEVGVFVQVGFTIIEGDAIASSIDVLAEEDDMEEDNDDDTSEEDTYVQLVGDIEEINDGQITVAGLTIDTTNVTTAADLEVGNRVLVMFVNEDGELTATEIRSNTDDDDEDNGDDNESDSDDDNESCEAEQPEGWTTYTIEAGDTLSGIAVASGTSLEQLIAVNCYQNNRVLLPGAVVFVQNAVTTDIPAWDGSEDDDNEEDNSDDNSGGGGNSTGGSNNSGGGGNDDSDDDNNGNNDDDNDDSDDDDDDGDNDDSDDDDDGDNDDD